MVLFFWRVYELWINERGNAITWRNSDVLRTIYTSRFSIYLCWTSWTERSQGWGQYALDYTSARTIECDRLPAASREPNVPRGMKQEPARALD